MIDVRRRDKFSYTGWSNSKAGPWDGSLRKKGGGVSDVEDVVVRLRPATEYSDPGNDGCMVWLTHTHTNAHTRHSCPVHTTADQL